MEGDREAVAQQIQARRAEEFAALKVRGWGSRGVGCVLEAAGPGTGHAAQARSNCI